MSIVLNFSDAWRNSFAGVAIGILGMSSVDNMAPGPALVASLHATETKLRDRHAGQSRKDLEKLPNLRPYVDHYRRFDKTYHVLLQLESVAWRGRPVAGGSSLVSAMFAAELENFILTAGHDLEALRRPLTADVTRATERYLGIGERELALKPYDMSIRDTEGIVSTVLYGPDHRTRLTPSSRSVLFTSYAPDPIPDSEVGRHLRQVEALVRVQAPSAVTEVIEVRRST